MPLIRTKPRKLNPREGPFLAELIYVKDRKLELKLFPLTESVEGEVVEARD